jgi:hypothetical protein
MQPVTESQNVTPITATTTVFTGSGGMLGIFVSSTTAGTIAVSDGGTSKVAVFSPAAATFYPLPMRFATSLVVTIGGTCSCTVFWS